MRKAYYLLVLLGLLSALSSCKKDIQPVSTDSFMKIYSHGIVDYPHDVQTTGDGGYIIAGYTENVLQERQAMAIKINQYGDLEWQKFFGDDASTFSEFKRVKVAHNSLYFLGTQEVSDSTLKKEMYLVNTDFDGNLLNEYTFGGAQDQEGNDFVIKNNTFFLAGSSTKENLKEIGGAKGINPTGVKDCYIVKVDLSDTIAYEYLQFGGSSNDYINSITLAKNETRIFCGSVLNFSNNLGDVELSGDNCSIVKIDIDGGKLAIGANRSFGSTGTDKIAKVLNVVEESTDKLIVAGNQNNNLVSFIYKTGDSELLSKEAIDEATLYQAISDLSSSDHLIINDMKKTAENGFVLVGKIKSTEDEENNGLLLVNLDSDGNRIWMRTDADLGNVNEGLAVVQTEDGGFAVVGKTGFGVDGDILFLKVNKDGEL